MSPINRIKSNSTMKLGLCVSQMQPRTSMKREPFPHEILEKKKTFKNSNLGNFLNLTPYPNKLSKSSFFTCLQTAQKFWSRLSVIQLVGLPFYLRYLGRRWECCWTFLPKCFPSLPPSWVSLAAICCF